MTVREVGSYAERENDMLRHGIRRMHTSLHNLEYRTPKLCMLTHDNATHAMKGLMSLKVMYKTHLIRISCV